MFKIQNKIIKITKGDSAAIKLNLQNADGTEYVMNTGDTVTLTVRKEPSSPIIMQVTSSSNIIDLVPNDTRKLEVGQCCYDIQLNTSAGDVFTVVGVTDTTPLNMIVYDEVTV